MHQVWKSTSLNIFSYLPLSLEKVPQLIDARFTLLSLFCSEWFVLLYLQVHLQSLLVMSNPPLLLACVTGISNIVVFMLEFILIP